MVHQLESEKRREGPPPSLDLQSVEDREQVRLPSCIDSSYVDDWIACSCPCVVRGSQGHANLPVRQTGFGKGALDVDGHEW